MRDTVAVAEKRLLADRNHIAATIRLKAEAKLSTMNSEVLALKEALDLAKNARQVDLMSCMFQIP